MKYIALTQRCVSIHDHQEIYDSLDRRWYAFLYSCGYIPLLLPNDVRIVDQILKNIPVQGFLLTGGGNITAYEGTDVDREKVEDYLIQQCIDSYIPLIGICRGMQKIQDHFNIPLEKIKEHVQPFQTIMIHGQESMVNSYHNLGTKEPHPNFHIWATSADGIVKGITHDQYSMMGIMWHPERMNPYRKEDKILFQEYYQ